MRDFLNKTHGLSSRIRSLNVTRPRRGSNHFTMQRFIKMCGVDTIVGVVNSYTGCLPVDIFSKLVLGMESKFRRTISSVEIPESTEVVIAVDYDDASIILNVEGVSLLIIVDSMVHKVKGNLESNSMTEKSKSTKSTKVKKIKA